jgi:hypothetical protein
MSKHVDWERDDLFLYILAFCKRDLSRHVSLRLLWSVGSVHAGSKSAAISSRSRRTRF